MKLKQNKNLIKIGITGSFGKTSVKNIINSVLCDYYYTLATPLSYNTMMGISKTINNYLTTQEEILICELGAYRQKEIKELTKFIEPHIAIITEIGTQHLETFKTIECTTKTKFEILEYSSFDTIGVLNYDNSYIKNYQINNVKTLYKVGTIEGDYVAKNIKVAHDLTIFDLYHQDEYIMSINTHLLGRHNVINILIAYATIQALKQFKITITDKQFSQIIYELLPIPHRLSYSHNHHINLYDDSYNANFTGFTNAIEVLSKTKEPRVIITPGIVEQGKASKELNYELAKKIAETFSDIYLINNPSIHDFLSFFDENHITYKLYPSFKKAYEQIEYKYKDVEINLLIENDLPDNYLERNK